MLFAFLLTLPAALPFLAETAASDSTVVMSATLPSGRDGSSAAWDGSNAYIFGGRRDASTVLDEILRYNPAAGTVTLMGAKLPAGRFVTSAVWAGGNFYIFGGYDGTTMLDQIVRYNPALDTVTLMGAKLPTGRYTTSAVWDGSHAYIFGGYDGGYSNQIVRYNPALDTLTIMGAMLPTGGEAPSAVWDGSNAYIFGGRSLQGGGWSYSDQIARYNPALDTVTTMSTTLPTGRSYTSAAWDGRNAYIFGGYQGAYSDQIVQYNPASNLVTPMPATLPTARAGTSAVWGGDSAYVFGGHDGQELNTIVQYNERTSPRSFLHQEKLTVTPATPVPPGDVPGLNIATVSIHDDDSGANLCVDLIVSGGPTLNIACVERFTLGPADALIPRGQTTLLAPLPTGSQGSTPHTTLTLDATYLYEPARVFPTAQVLGGAVKVYRPFEPSPDGALWFATHGEDVPLRVSASLYKDGVYQGAVSQSLPWLGQVLAAADATAGTPP